MSEGAIRQSRAEQINEKELPTTRTAQPRRPISQHQSETNSTSAIDPSTSPTTNPPPPSSARGRHHHPQNGADRFQHQAINTDRSTSGTNEVESDDGGPNGIAHRTTDVADRPLHREDRGGGRPAPQRQGEGKQSNIKRGTYLDKKGFHKVSVLEIVSPDGAQKLPKRHVSCHFSTPKNAEGGGGNFFPGGQFFVTWQNTRLLGRASRRPAGLLAPPTQPRPASSNKKVPLAAGRICWQAHFVSDATVAATGTTFSTLHVRACLASQQPCRPW